MSVNVGFTGLGRMGSRMARNIAKAGFPLAVYNRTTARAETLANETGAQVTESPRELAQRSDVVVSMLADGPAVESVYLGDEGVAAGLEPGKVAVEMSTVGPRLIGELAGPVTATGADLIDAPVSGSVATAEAAALTIMVGGASESFEKARPVLESLGSTILHVGARGAGATMKLAVNSIIFGFNQALSEALVLAERAGVERSTAYDVFAQSAVAAPVLLYRRRVFETPGETPVTFTMDLGAKDLRLILAMAEEVSAPMPQAEENLKVMERASEAGFGEDDMGAIAQYLRTEE